ncbi:hypothetical protein TNCV_2884631 [Trichonephila clavipes]|nr:hypothetical protein TNCV_2884631 [Trichonephila clavipes]
MAVTLSTMQVTVRFTSVSRKNSLGVGQEPPTSHSLPPTSQEDLRLDGCLEYPHLYYTFTNIHFFTGIRTQALLHSSQRR